MATLNHSLHTSDDMRVTHWTVVSTERSVVCGDITMGLKKGLTADHSRRAAARLATEGPRGEERCLQMQMAGDASARALKAVAKVPATPVSESLHDGCGLGAGWKCLVEPS